MQNKANRQKKCKEKEARLHIRKKQYRKEQRDKTEKNTKD